MIYDAVLCVSPSHKHIALKALRSLHLFSEARKFVVVASRQNLEFFDLKLGSSLPLSLLDEDEVIDGIRLSSIQRILEQRIGSSWRAGWYFQQFLKMSIADCPALADHYLVWDSDTILLKPLTFFDRDERILVNPQSECHRPYFELMERVLGIEKQVNYSFVSEHFMINKAYMKELLKCLERKAPHGTVWAELILRSIDDHNLGRSGFSEYETYGNFIALKYRESFECRPLKSIRNGSRYCGKDPQKHDLLSLMQGQYAFATFEDYRSSSSLLNHLSRVRVSANRARARAFYLFCRQTNRCSEHMRAVSTICCCVS